VCAAAASSNSQRISARAILVGVEGMSALCTNGNGLR